MPSLEDHTPWEQSLRHHLGPKSSHQELELCHIAVRGEPAGKLVAEVPDLHDGLVPAAEFETGLSVLGISWAAAAVCEMVGN